LACGYWAVERGATIATVASLAPLPSEDNVTLVNGAAFLMAAS
jgi:hypothetical protein